MGGHRHEYTEARHFRGDLAIIAVWAFLFLQGRHEMARRVHQVKDILLASKLYSLDHFGQMPAAFAELASLRCKWDGRVYYDPTSWNW
jgi:hypothetical protein